MQRHLPQLLENDRRTPHATLLSLLATALELAPDDHAALDAAYQSARRPSPTSPGGPVLRSSGSLPILPTRLIGRERETAAAIALLERSDGRLLTLTGPGGVGKSSLALRVAHEVAAGYADGAYVVPLAALVAPALVAATVAAVVGVREERDRPILESLRAYLAARQALLLLDNFEHLLDAAGTVGDLLASCPGLDVLVTSRAPLRVRGEQELPVLPLARPDPARLPDKATIASYPAVALFVERAQAVRPDFALTEATAPAVARIRARLDGLPLALELAAVRVKILPLGALEARLADPLALLTGGARDLPSRQRTLRDTLAWSYNLLDAAERTLFRRLAVFVGGCTTEAVERVRDAAGTAPAAALDGLAALVDGSLLRVEPDAAGMTARFTMLETVRAFALGELEADAVRAAHAAYVREVAERVEPTLGAAARLAHRQADYGRAVVCCEESLALAQALGDEAQMAVVLNLQGSIALVRGDFERAERHYDESLSLYRTLGDAWGVATALYNSGHLAQLSGDFERAARLCEESLAYYRRVEDRKGSANALNILGNAILCHRADYGRAEALHREGLALGRGLGDHELIAIALSGVALTLLLQGDHDAAARSYRESLALSHALGYRRVVVFGLEGLARVAHEQGQSEQAVSLFAAAMALHDALGAPIAPIDRDVFERLTRGLRQALGDERFAAAWQGGQISPLEQIVAMALRDESDESDATSHAQPSPL